MILNLENLIHFYLIHAIQQLVGLVGMCYMCWEKAEENTGR